MVSVKLFFDPVHSTSEHREYIQMSSMENRNRKIIDAVIRKEQAVCPGAVALIGIYGSFMTGDVHPAVSAGI